MENDKNEMLGMEADRDEKNDVAEGDIGDMTEVDAELGIEEVMTKVMGAGEEGDERIYMAEAENDSRMTEGGNGVNIVGYSGRRNDDGMMNECLDERVGEMSKDGGMVDDVHDEQSIMKEGA